MANRFPLVLDTTDGNKIKELPDGDNLDLTNSSITSVNDITSAGTISTQELLVRGNTVAPVEFSDLVDTPDNFTGSANYFVKVNAAGNGIEFRPLGDIGNIDVEGINISGDIIPTDNGSQNIGSDNFRFNKIRVNQLAGSLVDTTGSVVFDYATGKITYAALQGTPQFLSEFTDDIGFLRTADLDDTLGTLFGSDPFVSDLKGSVVADDSTVIIDGVAGLVLGDIQNDFTQSNEIVAGDLTVTNVDVNGTFVFSGAQAVGLTIQDSITGVGGLVLTTNGSSLQELINISPALADGEVNIDANKIRLLGDVSEPITASGGFVGDLTGSVVSDNSTVIIDGVAGKIIAPNVTGTATFEDNVIVVGNLTVQGSTTSVETTNTTITDNIITLNEGETGAGVSLGTAGIEIDRGTNPNVSFVWSEADSYFTTGTNNLNGNIVSATTRFEGALTGNVTGDVTGDLTGDSAGTHTGPVVGIVTGYLIGDMTGSVFADDSTVIVDAVNNSINATTADLPIIIGGQINPSDGGTISLGGSFGSVSYNDSSGNIQIATTGTTSIIGAASGAINIGTSTSGTVTIGNGTNTIDINTGSTLDLSGVTVTGATFNLSGDIDNSAELDIGGTNATAVNIGRAGITTTINGTVSFASALIANNITADDSIQITTAVGSNNAITIRPQGTNNSINLTSDTININGTVGTSFTVNGVITGDIKGSIFADDSTLLVDSVNGIIPKANIQDSTNWDTAYGWGDHAGAEYLTSVAFGDLTSTPSTLAGYGIIDAATSAQGALADSALQEGDKFDVIGSVFADDSTVLVDALTGTIPGYVSIEDLKTALQDGAGDYAAFKAWVLANL
jgi:hypothetical protein